MNWLIIILTLSLLPSMPLVCHRCFSQQQVNAFSQLGMLFVFVICAVSPLLIAIHSSFHWQTPIVDNITLSIDLYYDELTWVMLCLVSFVSLIIHSYAARYLLSDQNQARLIGQLSLLTFSVILLMMSGSLFTAFIAWQLIGLSLFLLLNHYHYDVKANKAAKKKFMINRVGDICFLLAVIITFRHYGSTAFPVLFAHQTDINWVILALIFIAIMTKSAQFPFHIWLIDTMEVPTPVSALMHAGVISAGGFLLVRLSLLYSEATYLLLFIFLIGLLTTLLGSFFGNNQSDIKKQLAYSTMSQVGYMIMQCGLGCFSSAVFHLIAHGFFKTTLFLSAGSTLKQSNQSICVNKPNASQKKLIVILSLLVTAMLIGLGQYYMLAGDNQLYLGHFLWLFMAITLFQLIKNLLLKSRHSTKINTLLIVCVAVMFAMYLMLLKHFNLLLADSVDEKTFSVMNLIIIVALLLIVGMYFLIKKCIPCALKQRLMYKLYFLGFYKGNIERYYRRYLINPMRQWGDWLLKIYYSMHSLGRIVIIWMILIYFVLSVVYSVTFHHPTIYPIEIVLTLINLILFMVILLIANRVATLFQFLITLLLSMLALAGIAFFMDKHDLGLIGSFHIINVIFLVGGFCLLLLKRQGVSQQNIVIQNQLPWCHFYMSLFLMLLIGIPGTASFISEFYLLSALLQIHFTLAIMFGAGMVLLALAVLHTLQVHFFNPKTIAQHAAIIPPWLHSICVLIIIFNIVNGIYPSILLGAISTIQ